MGVILQLIAGPVLGLVGSWVGSIFKYVEKKQDLKAQESRQAHERDLLKMNIDARGKEMENEAIIHQIDATATMLRGSYEHDASYGQVSRGAALWLRSVRPALTFSLVGLTAAVYFTSGGEAVFHGMTVRERVVGSILMMTEAAVTWWFADRTRQSQPATRA
jgi:hypothetical protein